jgi:hypothetical protein
MQFSQHQRGILMNQTEICTVQQRILLSFRHPSRSMGLYLKPTACYLENKQSRVNLIQDMLAILSLLQI